MTQDVDSDGMLGTIHDDEPRFKYKTPANDATTMSGTATIHQENGCGKSSSRINGAAEISSALPSQRARSVSSGIS